MKPKILIIDDEGDLCRMIKLNLEKTGKLEVLTATNGAEGMRVAREARPNLIFLDIMMPGMDGGEVAERLLEDESTRSIPIIFLTAAIRKDEVEEKQGTIGGREFMAKPVQTAELLKKIESVLAVTGVEA